MITALSAANAYAKAQKSLGVDAGIGGGAPPVQGGGFGDLLKNVMSQTVETSRNAERQMVNQVQGKAELIDVVTAVQAAEQSLETVMAVRDQVISAYQEIMRMPI